MTLKRRTRLEKLMDARVELQKAANTCDRFTTNRLLEAIDYLYFEMGMLIREVEELRQPRKRKGQR